MFVFFIFSFKTFDLLNQLDSNPLNYFCTSERPKGITSLKTPVMPPIITDSQF